MAGICGCARGRTCVTASGTMEFLRQAEGPAIFCAATPKKEGRTLSAIQVEMFGADKKLVATGTLAFFMMEKRQASRRRSWPPAFSAWG